MCGQTTGAPAPLPAGARLPDRHRRLPIQRADHRFAARAARAALCARRGSRRRTSRSSTVPGAFELPQAARCAAETGRFDAIVCLGCVIRGETPHFEYIASSAAHGVMAAAGETGVPMAFGVLTTDTEEQARARAGKDDRQQGARGRGRRARDGGVVPAAWDVRRRRDQRGRSGLPPARVTRERRRPAGAPPRA